MIGDPIIRWLYIKSGDTLEYKDRYDNVKLIGPVLKVDWRPDKGKYPTHRKKFVLVPALREPCKAVSVPLERVQAVIRDGVEVIRFKEDEKQIGIGCIECWDRSVDVNIPGTRFCSLHCMLEWRGKYYQDYAPGTDPIDTGKAIHSANCGECRKTNRIYCPKCVD